MARYFRCEEPTSQCLHARTREIQVEHVSVCPIGNPHCERYRRPVPWRTALRERHPKAFWAGLGLAGVVTLALLLSAVLGGSGWKAEVAELQAELSGLDHRLTEAESIPSTAPPPNSAELQRLSEQVQLLTQAVHSAVESGAVTEVAKLRAEADTLERNVADAFGGDGSDSDPVPLMAAKQLVHDYEGLEERAESALSALAPTESEGANRAFSELIEQIRDGVRRAHRLAAPMPPSPEAAELRQRIKTDLASARETLDQLARKPQPPFPPGDAGLVISASLGLADSLVVPLLQARWGGTLTRQPDDQSWFLASQDPEIAPGAVVRAVAEDPYGPLIDGAADLVVTEHSADDAIRARFARAFSGKELDSRAYLEVVALDAVALLAHPDAPTAAVGLADLARGPWLVRADDGTVIRRLTAGVVAMTPVADPFQSVLDAAAARAVALFHQCKPNLRAKYLPFQPAAEVRALAPSSFSIGTEEYGLSFRIVAAQSPRSRPTAKHFIDYLTSDEGQNSIAKAGFVDLQLRHRGEPVDPEVLAILAEALGLESITSASRYSTNLRFAIDKDELDIKAQADIHRLPRELARDFPTGKVVILGFADNTGTAEHNHSLSIRRASHIAAQLRQLGISAAAAGLGQQMPVDSNDTEDGRARNRRAEVWVVQPPNTQE